ncbi:MAG: DUF2914 domain-containing protein [Polyangiaceae bacterium]|nr:DUF2914 domain-containing protein [Polyangiaceae bacterium]
MSRTTPCISALALFTATLFTAALTGCGEGRAPRAAGEAQPAIAAPAQAPAPAAAPPASCPAPAAASAPAAAPPAASAAPAAPAKARRAASDADVAAKLRVKRLVLAEQVKGREPVEEKTSFHAADTDRIYAFVEVENGAEEETEITVSFEPPGGGAAKGNVTLPVGASPRWRTWAFTRGARVAGGWTAVVRAPDGKVLARAPFDVTL